MKTLLLVRHAKSSRDDPALPDKDRPLEARGERDAPRMGKRMHERDVKIDLMVSSPAARAFTTAQLIAAQLDYALDRIEVHDRLYPGAKRELLALIRSLDDKLKCVMLIAHNPGLSELAHGYCDDITHMPTCAVAEFTFDADSWSDIGEARLASATLDSPKKL